MKAVLPNILESVGFFGAAIGAGVLLKPYSVSTISILACLALYLASRDLPSLFAWIKFAKPAWVSFVSVAIAVLIAAHAGGWHADIIIAGLATMRVGRMFDSLY